MSKENFFDSAIEWTRKQGFSEIKANYSDYDAPISFQKPNSDASYTPDITGVKMGGKSFFEIVLKTEQVRQKVTKWMLLSTMAARKGGKLYLLAPRGHKSFAADIVEQHHLNAQIVSI